MMTDLEKVEKLREKTGVSYTDAKEALENTDGSILEAIIYLEKQGKVETPPGGGFYSGAKAGAYGSTGAKHNRSGESFEDVMRRFGSFLIKILGKGMVNQLVAKRGDERLFALPIIAFIVLLVFFWVTLPLFIITLFCGIRYHFVGPDIDKEAVNNVMKSASNMTEEVKNTFTEEVRSVKDTSAKMIAAVPGTIDATQAESRFIDPSNIDEAIIHAELINDAVDAEYVEVSAMPPVQSGMLTPETKDEVVYL